MPFEPNFPVPETLYKGLAASEATVSDRVAKLSDIGLQPVLSESPCFVALQSLFVDVPGTGNYVDVFAEAPFAFLVVGGVFVAEDDVKGGAVSLYNDVGGAGGDGDKMTADIPAAVGGELGYLGKFLDPGNYVPAGSALSVAKSAAGVKGTLFLHILRASV